MLYAPDALSGANINYGSRTLFVENAEQMAGATAPCPPGEIATGGGSDSLDSADTGFLLTSKPLPFDGPATSWQALYEEPANAGDIFVFVICMPA